MTQVSPWPSACTLVAANLLPVYGVLELKWPVFALVALFWMEVVIIGLVTVLALVCAPASGFFSRFGKLLALLFFCFGYGLMTFFYGFALAATFDTDSFRNLSHGLFGASSVVPLAVEPDLASGIRIAIQATFLALLQAVGDGWFVPAAICALAARHLLAFFRHYASREAGLPALTFRPFGWLVLLHTVIVGGAAAAMAGEPPVWVPLLLIAVKTTIDLIAHLREWSRLHPPLSSAR